MDQQLTEIFFGIFDLPEGTDVRSLRQPNVPKWDSLAHVTLIGAVESAFDVSIDIADSLDLTSYEAILRYLEARRS